MNGLVAFLANWLPNIAIVVAIFGSVVGVWGAVATRQRYYDEYRRRKRR